MAELTGPSMLALVGSRSGSSLWRVFWPITALQQRGYLAEWDDQHAELAGALTVAARSPFDGVLLPRMSCPPHGRSAAAHWLDALRAVGRFAVYDADDDLFSIADTYRQIALGWSTEKTFDELEAERAERLWVMQQCDGVTVSTEHLAGIVRSFTDTPVIVVPNAIDVRWFRGVVRASVRQIPGLTIGWAGGMRADSDVGEMAEAWGRIAARYPAVHFVVQGHVPTVILERVGRDRLSLLPWMSLERYPSGLRQVDIACCSVAPTRFNASKSPIKAMEAALAGSAVVATPTLYGQLVEHEVTGLLATTADEWEAALSSLVERPALRSMLARRLLRDVERQCSLTENLWRWPAAWHQIAEDARSRRGRLVTVS